MTAACRIPFTTSLQLLPSSTPTEGTWTYIDPTLSGQIEFPVAMDQTVIPDKTDFILEVDSAAKPLDTVVWADATHLGYSYDEAVLGPTVVRMQYPAMLPNFRSLQGQPVFPFDILLTEV